MLSAQVSLFERTTQYVCLSVCLCVCVGKNHILLSELSNTDSSFSDGHVKGGGGPRHLAQHVGPLVNYAFSCQGHFQAFH